LLAPRRVAVDPGANVELPVGDRVRDERRRPAVGLHVLERHLAPPARAGAVADRRAQLLVPVAKHGRPHGDRLADRALDRVPAAVELRPDALDLDPGGPFLGDHRFEGGGYRADETVNSCGATGTVERHPPASDLALVADARPGRAPVRGLARARR